MHNFCAFALDLCNRCAYYSGMEVQESGDSENAERAWKPTEQAMLAALKNGETIDAAAVLMGISYSALYVRRQKDPVLDAAVKLANSCGRNRISERIAKHLYAGAEKCDEDPRFTTAAIFALKNLDPQNWRDSHEISGPGGGAIPMQIVMFGTPPDDDDGTTETDPGDAATGA